MFFLTYERNMFQFLQSYLFTNSLVERSAPSGTLERALVARAQEYGFKDLESYCRYVMLQSYRQMLAEMKHIAMSSHPSYLYEHKNQLDAVNGDLIADILEVGQEKKEEKSFSSKLLKMLTSEVEFSKHEEKKPFPILSLDTGYGEEIYSAAMRMDSISPEGIEPEYFATESDGNILLRAAKGKFTEPTMAMLSANYRSLYMERQPDGLFQVTPEIRKKIDIHKVDLLSSRLLDEDFEGKFKIVFCNNLHKFYPRKIVLEIIKRIIQYIAPGGVLFGSFFGRGPMPEFEGMKQVNLGKAHAYKRVDEKIKKTKIEEMGLKYDSIESRLAFIKIKFLEEDFNKALEMSRDLLNDYLSDVRANYIQGDIYTKLKKYENAISQYKKAVFINPEFIPGHFQLAALNLETGNLEEAKEQIDQFFSKFDKTEERIFDYYFKVKKENAKTIATELRHSIYNFEAVSLKTLEKKVDSILEDRVEPPDIKVPDIYGDKFATKELESEKESERPVFREVEIEEKKVVRISELPSTRDYGEHDPWKQKQLVEEESRKKKEELLLLHEDYSETRDGKVIPLKKMRGPKEENKKKSGWIDLLNPGGESARPTGPKRKPVKYDRAPKTAAIVHTKKHGKKQKEEKNKKDK